MKKLIKVGLIIGCLFMLGTTLTSCITIQPPTITHEETLLVEKIMARRVGYHVTKKHTWLGKEMEVVSNQALAVLKGTATDEEIQTVIDNFMEKLTGKYLSSDPMLQQDVKDLAEVMMPTVTIDMELEGYTYLDENMKAELIVIFTAFNEGVRIANEEVK